jgi:hypothetical protein
MFTSPKLRALHQTNHSLVQGKVPNNTHLPLSLANLICAVYKCSQQQPITTACCMPPTGHLAGRAAQTTCQSITSDTDKSCHVSMCMVRSKGPPPCLALVASARQPLVEGGWHMYA